ncbi:MAG TPA: thiamine phosphate synthase [Candidatus Limnocylindrales bacterium]|nr:thiamine phosphate synthase [Candidatus Limnocylindrales bacterium]
MRLYVITGEAGGIAATTRVCEAALEGGADVIQLRKKLMPKGEQYRLARQLRTLTRNHGALLIVNDHADIAVAADADGVHLGQDDLDPIVVRRLPGFEHRLIGRSTHSLAQALQAVEAGADYLGVGPVHATPTKAGRPAVGIELVRAVAAAVSLPFVAIGGIDLTNASQVVAAGARAVAVVRAVSDARDPRAAAEALVGQVTALLGVQV